MTVRMNADKSSGGIESNNDDDEITNPKEDDDELNFKRMQGSYQIINHNDTSSPVLHDHDKHDGHDDDEDDDDITDDIDKISWLPSLLSKKRRRRNNYRQSYTKRRENSHGDAYDSLDDVRPQTIEILPVLPLPMVPHSAVSNNRHSFSANGNNKYNDEGLTYASGVWARGIENEMFASPAYLPHTSDHVLSVAEPRYKRLYDDLLQLGEYWGERRKEAIRNARIWGMEYVDEEELPNPEEKRRFIVTVMHPSVEGVLAEYGVLFQLKDLDEVAAIASYEDEDDGVISVEEIQSLMEDADLDFSDVLLDTHYEATHDVVGIVKIHKFVNPECWDDEPEEEEYLMAEATLVDLTSGTKKKADGAKKLVPTRSKRQTLIEADQFVSMARQRAATEVTDAVSRIRDELRSAVGEAFAKQHTTATTATTACKTTSNNTGHRPSKNQIPLVPKGIFIERRSDGSLLKEEQELQDSFRKLVSIQQESKEKFRFTQGSIKSFGIGSIGLWLSAAAWSKFIDKRLEGANVEMQSELQGRLMEYLSETREENPENDEQESTIDYDDLSPELQEEFTLVQAHAARELGPAALQRAIQMQLIIQATNDAERLKLLKGCVDDERKRLEARKMLRLAVIDYKDDGRPPKKPRLTQRQARSVFEKLVKQDQDKRDDKLFPADAFQ